jgi:hypothetical protein
MGPFFEDVRTSAWTDTEINADTMAAYILDHPSQFSNWRTQARAVLDWTLATFANHDFLRWGVVPINEQTVYMVPGNSHTARHAAVELLYCEKTGDRSARDDAVRRLNWATYMVDSDGKNRYPQNEIWLTDGYGDYVRHYLRAMAADPALAPGGQNHLLRTSSVIQSIRYGPDRIVYRKFDGRSEERLKIAAWPTATVEGGTMSWDAAAKVLTIHASQSEVAIATGH